MIYQNTKITLGIDPGFADTGYGLIKSEAGKEICLACGSIKTAAGENFTNRLEIIYNEVNLLIKKYKPSALAIEELFFYKNTTTAMKVSQARGVVLLAAKQGNLSIHEYTPLQIKQALTGYGRADKKQMGLMVKAVLKLKEVPRPDDASDALAAALCYLANEKLERAANKTYIK